MQYNAPFSSQGSQKKQGKGKAKKKKKKQEDIALRLRGCPSFLPRR